MEKSKKKSRNIPAQLNKFMHPRNPYKNYHSFKELATLYPDFRKYCTHDITGKVFLNFKDKNALKALTTCLLDNDFQLKVNIPENRLVPTLPLRLNYLLWIEDLLNYCSLAESKLENNPFLGLDLGTGASCIYPLLGKKHLKWNFIATESDNFSFRTAKENVEANCMEDFLLVVEDSSMFEAIDNDNISNFISKQRDTNEGSKFLIDFSMCNPPFFSYDEENSTAEDHAKKSTRSEPHSVCTASERERMTEGGEIQFLSDMIESSIKYKDRIRIFSSMIGIQRDVKKVTKLIEEKCARENLKVNITTTEFCQGRTMRWGVAWTFDTSLRIDKIVSKKQRQSDKKFEILISKSKIRNYNIQYVWKMMSTWLDELKIKIRVFKENKYFVGATLRAYKPTWQNQRKIRREKLRVQKEAEKEKNGSRPKRKIDTEESVAKKFCQNLVIDENKKLASENESEESFNQSTDESEATSSENSSFNQSTEEMPSQNNSFNHSTDETSLQSDSCNQSAKETSQNKTTGFIENSEKTSNKENGEKTPDEIGKNESGTNKKTPDKTEKNAKNEGGTNVKTDSEDSEAQKLQNDPLLQCVLHLQHTNGQIKAIFSYVGGTGSKEAFNQLIQYLRNKIAMK